MLVNRSDFQRVLKVVESVEANEVKLAADGTFGLASKDGCSLLFGKGIAFGREVGIMDVGMLQKMLGGLSEVEINIEFQDSVMKLAGEKTVFGYRLGQADLIEGYPASKADEFEAVGLEGGEFPYEDFAKIGAMIKTLGVQKVSFSSQEGDLMVLVGDRKLFYGQLVLAGLKLSKEQFFMAERLKRVLDVVDAGKIGIAFSTGEKGLLKVWTSEFKWYIGALVE